MGNVNSLISGRTDVDPFGLAAGFKFIGYGDVVTCVDKNHNKSRVMHYKKSDSVRFTVFTVFYAV